jgi:copper homeostasis protein
VTILVEAAVETPDEALAAEQAGAGRVELCARLDVGGTSPARDEIARAVRLLRIPVMVMVRPRGGDFVYSDDEFVEMCEEVLIARAVEAHGVVLGLLNVDGTVDEDRTAELAEIAYPLEVVFHKAIDRTPDPFEALEAVRRAGVDRVLTSAGKSTAPDGARDLARMVHQAAGRPTILAGGGVRPDNVAQLVRASGVREVHARMANDEGRIRGIVDALR